MTALLATSVVSSTQPLVQREPCRSAIELLVLCPWLKKSAGICSTKFDSCGPARSGHWFRAHIGIGLLSLSLDVLVFLQTCADVVKVGFPSLCGPLAAWPKGSWLGTDPPTGNGAITTSASRDAKAWNSLMLALLRTRRPSRSSEASAHRLPWSLRGTAP